LRPIRIALSTDACDCGRAFVYHYTVMCTYSLQSFLRQSNQTGLWAVWTVRLCAYVSLTKRHASVESECE
jgi:hypothetical protein